MAMITELRDGQTLTRMFKRVVVVSHQDDFASAFPVGYRLRSEGGTTTVEAFGISAPASIDPATTPNDANGAIGGEDL
jgi:hypothetical protein